MDSVVEARRAKFEVWAAEKWPDNPDVLKRCGYGYMYDPADTAWYGYEAALDSLAVELPELTEPDAPEDAFDDSWRDGYTAARRYRSQCRQAIEKAGVKTK
jgi:hypothetical protein